MISFKMDVDLSECREMFDRYRKQLPYAAVNALNNTAFAVRDAEIKEIRDVFDRPKPMTQSGVEVIKATRTQLEAMVKVADFAGKGIPPAKYLAAELRGGVRSLKRFEKALQAVGALPSGYFAVPGAAAKMDGYGNMDPGQIVQILSFFKAFPEMGYKANMSDRRRAALAKGSKKKGRLGFVYFVGRPGNGLQLGVWQRVTFAQGSAVKPILIFVPSSAYQAIFDFDYVGKQVVDRDFAAQFETTLNQAIATAK